MTKRTWYEPHECAHGCAPLDEYYAHVERSLQDPGWFVAGVIGDEKLRPWAYTIGLLETFRHPELIVTGMCWDCAGHLLNLLGAEVARGRRFEPDPGGLHEFQGQPVRFVAVHASHWQSDRFNQWHGFYEDRGRGPEDPVALQVLWADRHDRFPNDPRGEKLQVGQPMLMRPPSWAN